MVIKVGFIVNPIAGIGGKRAWKGTDDREEAWDIFEKEEKYSYKRVEKALTSIPQTTPIQFYYCSDPMGEQVIEKYRFKKTLIYEFKKIKTEAADTKKACEIFLKKEVDLILFVGGDGTARDIASVVGQRVPILGIPSGVKMFSGCFILHPNDLGEIIKAIDNDDVYYAKEEVLDVDEELFREDKVSVSLFDQIITPHKGGLVQGGKIPTSAPNDDDFIAIANELKEEYNLEEGYTILGTGSTIHRIMKEYNIEKTLLGIDLMINGELGYKDVDSQLLNKYTRGKDVKLLLSPIGGQGFLLGRGNQQISSKVLKEVKSVNLIVVSTPNKINTINSLEIDLDETTAIPQIKNNHIKIITGYHQYKMRKIRI